MSSRFRRPSLLADGEGLDVAVEEHVERDAGFAVDGVVISDDELVEEGLVGDPAERIVDAHVDGVHVPGEGEAVVQVGFGLVVLDVAGVDLRVEEREPPRDAVLLGAEQVEGHGSGVMSLHELGALVTERVAFCLVPLGLVLGDLVQSVELTGDQLAQRGDDVFGYLDVAVVVLDGGFDVGHEHGLAFAVGAAGVPAGAHEVRVDDAAAALGVGQRQPGPALPAVQAAFQVVVMGLGLLPGGLVRGEHRLDAVPDLGRDQRFVQAVVAGTAEADAALVVGVGEHLVDRGQHRRLGGPLRGRHGGQAPVDEFLAQADRGVVPGGVGLEGPRDQWCPVGVDFDGADLAAEFVTLGDVEVAHRGLAVGPATLGFLVHALGDLAGEVPGVELRDGGHDAVQQHPGRGLVDVLGRGDEHDPGLFEGEVDGHVVGAVAGEPVDLVNNAVGDLVGLDVLDHPHQLGPVGLAGGLAGVDELLGDDRVQLAGLAQVRLALSGDREALVPSALGGLLFG
ncbi:MAG: hypothetical protein L0H96_00615 [Humibacillus sp.]|nr:MULTISPECIES: hypothetical protein [Actinomycetes]MCV7525522.1 hypothetical protein [Micrococcus luteus]MDN5764469.1 hypothetical protein [Humibacillus sp.]HQY96686.1 hypothetical protein [Phycicoccus sp.]MCT1515978.1 hypothetical protein [Dietzia cercidiphylli]MDN5775400.1 hypothetical protein [Humibacillus sp.]